MKPFFLFFVSFCITGILCSGPATYTIKDIYIPGASTTQQGFLLIGPLSVGHPEPSSTSPSFGFTVATSARAQYSTTVSVGVHTSSRPSGFDGYQCAFTLSPGFGGTDISSLCTTSDKGSLTGLPSDSDVYVILLVVQGGELFLDLTLTYYSAGCTDLSDYYAPLTYSFGGCPTSSLDETSALVCSPSVQSTCSLPCVWSLTGTPTWLSAAFNGIILRLTFYTSCETTSGFVDIPASQLFGMDAWWQTALTSSADYQTATMAYADVGQATPCFYLTRHDGVPVVRCLYTGVRSFS
eukprot:RCo047822